MAEQHPADARRRARLPTIGSATGWRAALREFAIIVAGVPCALGAQAWWQSREERGRERDHLRQVLADTRENERRLEDAIAQDSAGLVAMGRVMRTFAAPDAPLSSPWCRNPLRVDGRAPPHIGRTCFHPGVAHRECSAGRRHHSS